MINGIYLLAALFIADPTLPDLNQRIVEYLGQVMGKRVDRGECWDLAAGALNYSGAYFDRSSKRTINVYGKRVDPQRETIYPGDLIQFENVKLEWKKQYSTFREEMKHHTAIVYKVNGPGDYEIAHQNTSKWGRKVGVSRFVLSRVKKGKIMFYRPVKNRP